MKNMDSGSRRKNLKRAKRQHDVTEVSLPADLTQFVHAASVTVDELHRIVRQLRYWPMNIIRVAASNRESVNNVVSEDAAADSAVEQEERANPCVLLLYPLNKNANILGNYHESGGCPRLQARVAKLEEEGWVKKLSERLLSNTKHVEQMHQSHRAYAEYRWSLLSEDDKKYVEDSGWKNSLHDVGIAGISAFDSVKCLHCHYAHYLGKPEHRNLIGEWVHELLSERETE